VAGPLTGFTVIDLTTGLAGPLAGMLMADNGANVIRVTSPRGDPSMDTGGYPVWNRGKKGLVLDIEKREGVAVFERLLATADVLLESHAPGAMDRLGLGYAALHAKFPRLVYTSITGYGQVGSERDRPAHEALVHARIGIMANEHYKPRPGPIYTGFPMGGYGAASLALLGSVTALYVRETTGRGQHVDTSIRDGALAFYTMYWNKVEKGESGFASYSMKNRGPGIVDIFKCGDGGFIHFHTGAQGAFVRLMQGLGMGEDYPELNNIPDPEWARMLKRTEEWFLSHTRDEGMAMLNKADVPALPVLQPGEAMHDPQSKAMQFSEVVEDAALGKLEQVGISLRFAKTPGAIRGPAPRSGENTDEIMKGAGFAPAEIGRLRTAGVVA
jgi:crotonobetainyl-CoA:carnitine CoA-transferase CaiB-like acyl-CoA transferase